MSDGLQKAVAALSALLVNGGIFASMVLAGLINPEPAHAEPEYIPVEVVEIPRLGKEPEPNALPRIVADKPPPPPPAEDPSLSRKLKEEQLEEEKKKEQAEKERLAQEKKDQERQEREERKRRKDAMAKALANLDPRADEDAPTGLKDGIDGGWSNNPTLKNEMAKYQARLRILLSRQTQVPGTVPPDERKRLETHVKFDIGADGKVKGQPRVSKSSGNKQFDAAVLAAVRKFGPGSALPSLLPDDPQLKKVVMKQGITARLKGKEL